MRQGDVLGPLLFCYALKPAIEKTQQLFKRQFPAEKVTFHAYMDDITIIGTETACIEAYNLLTHELDAISLTVNSAKTVTTSTIVSESIGCVQSDCPKLLGAYVSRWWEKEKAEIDKLPEKHEIFFNRILKLPAEIAVRMLTLCGVPRWGHLIRTHHPEVVTEASTAFTEMSVRSLASILRIDHDLLTPEVYRQILMPYRCGGIGFIDWAEHAADSYASSLAGESNKSDKDDPNAPVDTQLRQSQFWEEKMAIIKKEHHDFFKHLDRHSCKMGSLWLTSPLTPLSAHNCNPFRAALLFRLGYAGRNPSAITTQPCKCAFPGRGPHAATTTNRMMMIHALGCRNGAITKRHHKVRDALIGILTNAGYDCTSEDPLNPEASRVMDIVARSSKGESLYVDVTVINALSVSNAGKPLPTLVAEKHKEKSDKYEALARQQGFTYKTFALETHGTMTADTQKFLQELSREIKPRFPDPADQHLLGYSATITPVSRALAYGNGLCLLASDQLSRLGVRFDRAAVPIVAPAVTGRLLPHSSFSPRAADDNDNAAAAAHSPPPPSLVGAPAADDDSISAAAAQPAPAPA